MFDTSSDQALGFGVLVIIGLIIWGVTSLVGGEREGFVKYDDCRQTINLKADTLQKYYKKFTCSYSNTLSGKIMGGTCVHVDTSGGLFSNESTCETAYVYEKDPEVTCSKEYPYLGIDDKCYTVWGSGRVYAAGSQRPSP